MRKLIIKLEIEFYYQACLCGQLLLLVLSNKRMNNCVWIMFDDNVIY